MAGLTFLNHRRKAMKIPDKEDARVRVCFVVESGTDVRLSEGLAEQCALTIVARHIIDGPEVSHRPSLPMDIVIGPASRLGFAVFIFLYLLRNKEKFDRVIVQGYGLAALSANLASRASATPTIMLVCSPVEQYYRCRKAAYEVSKPYHRREFFAIHALARANALLGRQYCVLSEYLSQVVRAHGTKRPIHIVPIYGVDASIFVPPSGPKAELKTKRGLPSNGSLLVVSSRMAPEKDYSTLLQALQRLLKDGRNLWVLHRSGGYRSFLLKAESYGIADRVIATNAVHPHRELPADYQCADLCIQPSREEGLGFTALEALACLVPVIAAKVGGLQETIIDGTTGWTYPVGDADALADCIMAALDDPREAHRRARHGRELVLAYYERRRVFDQFSNLISAAAPNFRCNP
jgi:glycosyltransferase involved in cell wall biosynthesis